MAFREMVDSKQIPNGVTVVVIVFRLYRLSSVVSVRLFPGFLRHYITAYGWGTVYIHSCWAGLCRSGRCVRLFQHCIIYEWRTNAPCDDVI